MPVDHGQVEVGLAVLGIDVEGLLESLGRAFLVRGLGQRNPEVRPAESLLRLELGGLAQMGDGLEIVALLPVRRAQGHARFVVVGLQRHRGLQLLDALIDTLHANVERAQVGVSRRIFGLKRGALLVGLRGVVVVTLATVEITQAEPRRGVVRAGRDGLLHLGDGFRCLALSFKD